MNALNLSERLELLVLYLTSNEYSDSYIGKYQFVSKFIVENQIESSNIDDDFFKRIYHLLELRTVSKSTFYEYRCIIRSIRDYIILEVYPNKKRKSHFLKKNPYESLTLDFQSIIDCYVNNSQGRKKETAISSEKMMGITFLTHLQNEGCMTVSDISETSVLSFFYSEGKIIREATYKGHITAVLKANLDRGAIFRKLISFLPHPPRMYIIILMVGCRKTKI